MHKITILEKKKLLGELLYNELISDTFFNKVSVYNNKNDLFDNCSSEFNILLFDISSIDNIGSFIDEVKNKYTHIKLIAMYDYYDVKLIEYCKNIKIDSFILLDTNINLFINTIKQTIEGYSIYPNINNVVLHETILSSLSSRELDILSLYCKWADRNIVADKLGISERTLKYHISSIYEKTGYDSLSKLALYCVSNNLINPNIFFN